MKSLFLIFTFLIFGYSANASESTADTKNSIFYYTTTNYNKSINDIKDFEFKKKLNPQIGYIDSLVWVKICIENKSNYPKEYILTLNYPLINYIDFYQFNDEKLVKEINTGDNLEFSTREIDSRHFVFKIVIDKNKSSDVFLRINGEGDTIILPLELIEANNSYNESSTLILILGLLYGVFFFTILFNLLMYIYIKSRLFLYYTLYILLTFLFLSYTDGFIFQFLFPENIILNEYSITFFIFSGLIFMLLFYIDYLKIYDTMPKVYKITLGFIGLGILLTILSFFSKHMLYIILELSGLYALSVMMLIIITSLIIMIKKQNKFAVFFLASITFWVIGLVIYLLRDYGVIEDNFFTLHSIKIGVALEVSVMSILLIQRFRTQLNDVNNELTEQNVLLDAAREKAEESDKLKSSFLMNLSHEIRTPLNAIVGFADLMTDPENSVDEVNNYSTIINSNAYYLTDIVGDAVAISKIEQNSFESEDRIELFRKCLEEVNSKIEKLNVRFADNLNSITIDNNVPDNFELKIDSTKLEYLLLHLVSNAYKFTKNGEIILVYNLENNKLKITISDTGVGIDKSEHEKIFNKFYKIETNQEHLYRGNGLGLPIALEIAKLYNGTINVESELGKGSVFTVILSV